MSSRRERSIIRLKSMYFSMDYGRMEFSSADADLFFITFFISILDLI